MDAKITDLFDKLTPDTLKMLLGKFKESEPHIVLSNLRKDYGTDADFVYTQLTYYYKIKNKLPSFSDMGCLVTKKAFEQCSSESTALFKASLINGLSLLDISSGLGVDDWAFASCIRQIIALDPDEQLNLIVQHNYALLGVGNVSRLTTTAEEYLNVNSNSFDWIYVDADRRPNDNRKYALEASTPNIIQLLPLLHKISGSIMIKVSPMLDIAETIKQLPGTSAVYVVAMDGEVKELLFLINSYNTLLPTVYVIELDSSGAVLYQNSKPFGSKVNLSISLVAQGDYFVEPSAALIKSDLWRQKYMTLGINVLHQNCVYGIAKQFPVGFWGRVFKVCAILKYNAKKIKEYLLQQNITQANVAARNFVWRVDEIKRQMQIKDGGDAFLFFTTLQNGDKVMIHAAKKLVL